MFALIITLWIAAINVLVLTFFKYKEIDRLNNEARLYTYIKSNNHHYSLPKHIKILNRYERIKNFKMFGVYNNKFVYFSKKYIRKDMNSFVLTLILWELALSFLLVIMLYAVLRRFSKKEKQYKEFLRFLLGAISHKFGNFLSVQRLNLELIETNNKKPLERLKEAYVFMEKDFKNIIDIIKNSEEGYCKKYEVADVIKDSLNLFKERLENKKVHLSLVNATIKSNGGDFYNVMHELIENSIKYSDKYIHIKLIKKSRLLYILIINDIGKSKSGSGFGLNLVRYISSKNRWNFEAKVVDEQFQAALVLKL